MVSTWQKWSKAMKRILPTYILTHLLFLALTYFSSLFLLPNFTTRSLPLHTLLDAWNRWDTGHFIKIATAGYEYWWQTAFYPLFPFALWCLLSLVHNPLLAGLIIANVADLCLLTVLYRLIEEDFDAGLAERTVLYFALFPTAFFLVAAYNESLFMTFALLSLYQMRHGRWWLAGLFGILASLTRSAGLLLLVPFCYEYLYQKHFKLSALRFDLLAGIGIPLGMGFFMLYCFVRFHDALASFHAQAIWHRSLDFPFWSILHTAILLLKLDILSFHSIHNVFDLLLVLFVLTLGVLCCVGPWKFSHQHRVYALYSIVFILFGILWPTRDYSPLHAFPRYLLEAAPVFLLLAKLGENRWLQWYYLTISTALLSFALLQFLTGHWMI
jgi:Gpi18-like mannosyltransferase